MNDPSVLGPPVGRSIGRTRWAIAEGYIPGWSHGPEPQMVSHETVCLLNATDRDAHVEITIFFADREPAGPYPVTVPARRTRHVRFNDLSDPEPIPHDTDFSSVIESDVPIVAQHTRLDSRQAENALLSTIAFAAD
ncbi:MAG TPA: sensory rhodopsin transducer [Thermoanaerobaculia bacterium]|nr:sensory rhodopsin transducer [Thermoanaerobaculia bacterium]